MSKYTRLLLPILILFMSGCAIKKQQELPFDVIEEGIAFSTKEKKVDKIPHLIVISNFAEVTQLEFADAVVVYLDEVDFSQSFVLLVLRGQLADSGTVKEVVRVENEVIVRTREIDPGPGSYTVSGFTFPYQIIKVNKVDVWNEDINFLLDREGTGVVSERTIFVP